MSDFEMPVHEMIVVAFDNEFEAQQVLDSLKGMDAINVVDLKSAAVIVRDADGKVQIKETRDFDAKQGAIGGAVAGGLLGLLGGGLLRGAILGAAGGAAAGEFVDLGLDDDFLKAVGESLGPSSSAIVALVDFQQVDQAMEELDKFAGGRILRHSLSDEVYAKLSEAVED
ncbi:MAG: DUF1269 domain-containing protein [Anaerolineales bacterium]|nr:DUF1269 domain-containing protein [Anaerolineales bacterium]